MKRSPRQPDGPIAKKRSHPVELHGRKRNDPYHWLRDDGWQRVMRDPTLLRTDIREHLEEENAHVQSVLATTGALRDTLFQELRARIKENDTSVPVADGPHEYYMRYELGAQHPRYCRRPRTRSGPLRLPTGAPDEKEEVLFDADRASRGHAYFSTRGVSHSRDHGLLAVGVDMRGSEYYQVSFRDLKSGQRFADVIDNTSGTVVFSADAQVAFYVAVDDHHRPSKVYRHRLGCDASADVLVYEEPDPGFFVSLGQTEDYRHLVISAHDHTTTELRLIDANAPESEPRLIAPRRRGVEYDVSAFGDELLLLTNDGAEDFKIVRAPLANPGPDTWRELVPHRPGCLIAAVVGFAEFVVRLEVEDALPRLVVRRIHDDEEHVIAFDEKAYSLGLVGGYEYETRMMRFTYSSPTTPPQTYDYDMQTRERTLLKQREIPSGHDPTRFRCAREHAEAEDGQKIPITLLWHESTPIDSSAPLLLYGYGSYGHSIPAAFSENRLSLVERGFVYAVAHVRGGKEKGYGWYTAGKLMKKRNTFFDFIRCAEHLCEARYTSRGNISIHGGSAGGMLVGAATNLRPELFKAVVGQVPFVDVLNTMCDASLPLTPPEWNEWGNPLESAEAYDYIASYSPYDNVEAKDYPHILATAGLTDPRVTYWEPAKWVARLRELRTNDNLLLLHTYMEAGHGGAAGRFEKLREIALVYAFLLLAHGRVDAQRLPAA